MIFKITKKKGLGRNFHDKKLYMKLLKIKLCSLYLINLLIEQQIFLWS